MEQQTMNGRRLSLARQAHSVNEDYSFWKESRGFGVRLTIVVSSPRFTRNAVFDVLDLRGGTDGYYDEDATPFPLLISSPAPVPAGPQISFSIRGSETSAVARKVSFIWTATKLI